MLEEVGRMTGIKREYVLTKFLPIYAKMWREVQRRYAKSQNRDFLTTLFSLLEVFV